MLGVPGKQAYVVVCGNEKGGSGKTTTSMHLAVALLNAGYKVATVDLDSRQLSFTRYIENRILWARRQGLNIRHPDHFPLKDKLIVPSLLILNSPLLSEGFEPAVKGFESVVFEFESTFNGFELVVFSDNFKPGMWITSESSKLLSSV